MGGVRKPTPPPPPIATTPNTPAVIRKIGLPIPSSTLFKENLDIFAWSVEYYRPYGDVLVIFIPGKSTERKLLLMRKSSHLLSWRDVVLD